MEASRGTDPSGVGRARAPASSGNLGPGFDTVALALDLWCRCEVEPGEEWVIEEEGGRRVAAADDLVVRAVRLVTGDRPMTLRIDNEIPRSRGLGSSSAVAVALAAATLRASGTEPTDRTLFDLVCELEGHPDNAAAAVYGGLVAAFDGEVARLEMADALRVVVAVPDRRLSTREARAALPATVPLEVAARSVARTAMLVEGLRTGDAATLAKAGGDELHEGARRGLSPLTATLIEAARGAGAMHAAWSGAGPAVIAFVTDATAVQVDEAMTETLEGAGVTMRPKVANRGWQ